MMSDPPLDLPQALASLERKQAEINAMANDIDSLNREIEATHRGLMAIHQDLEVRGIELENARRHLAASEKLAALGSLVSGVAHEVRTPLTIIATNLHVLGRYAAKGTQTGDYARLAECLPYVTGEIDSAIDRVQGLVKGLSRFTRVRSISNECLLDPIVREAVDLYDAVNRSHTRVVVDLRAPDPVVLDKSQVQQIVINLIENAVQASRASDRPVSVRTYADPEGVGVVLEVADRGSGMTTQTQAQMFEPLYTTKVDGTGVGLTIVQRIVREHDATIQCHSEIGVGTTFTIHFPAPRSREVVQRARPKAGAAGLAGHESAA